MDSFSLINWRHCHLFLRINSFISQSLLHLRINLIINIRINAKVLTCKTINCFISQNLIKCTNTNHGRISWIKYSNITIPSTKLSTSSHHCPSVPVSYLFITPRVVCFILKSSFQIRLPLANFCFLTIFHYMPHIREIIQIPMNHLTKRHERLI